MALHDEHGDEIAKLKAEIAALKAAGQHPALADEDEEEEEDAYPDKTDADLKEMIASISGAKPRGNPSRQTLVSMLDGLDG